MSRIGRLPITVPAGVTITVSEANVVEVKGPKGTLTKAFDSAMNIALEENQVVVTRPNDLKRNRALHGLTRTLIANMIEGVTNGYAKVLEINGVGYRAQKQGKKLVLSLGYSHPVEMEDPEGITTTVDGNRITVAGINKEQIIFPEIEYDKIDKVRGMDVIIVTTAHTDEESRELLRQFGMPFQK
ncbi:50S ribosomal protein L6 [Zhenhengia sp.]|uniref:50S ribosomal protein L6 n=1 Tax=Zhenhengia sp. TaxID=2944208 RepID=UPI0030796CD9